MSSSLRLFGILARRLHNTGLLVLAIGTLALIAHLSHEPLLLAPFAPSILVILTQPRNPHVAPPALIAAYVVATIVAILLKEVLPPEWWGVAIAAGAAMLALEVLDTLHPPAVAMPILVMTGSGPFPLPAFIMGVVVLAGLSLVCQRLARRPRQPVAQPAE